jgi:hypothetical protein
MRALEEKEIEKSWEEIVIILLWIFGGVVCKIGGVVCKILSSILKKYCYDGKIE